jgi:hypothetical protein
MHGLSKERRSLQAFLQDCNGEGDRIMSRTHLTEEEVYDIFRDIFHNEEEALAATIQLFRGDPISRDEDYE